MAGTEYAVPGRGTNELLGFELQFASVHMFPVQGPSSMCACVLTSNWCFKLGVQLSMHGLCR